MKARAFAITCISVLALASCDRHAQPKPTEEPPQTWYRSFADAQAEAQKTGDRIVLSFEAYWDPWSRLLRTNLYSDSSVIDSLRSFVCLTVDADHDTAVTKEFGVAVYPTIIVTDSYGSEIGRMAGYQTPEQFLARLAMIGRREDLLSEMFRQEEQSAGDPSFLLSLGNLLMDVGMYDAALIRFERAARMDEDRKLGIRDEAVYSMAECSMLAGDYLDAARRFAGVVESDAGADRREHAGILAGLCFDRAGRARDAARAFEAYLESYAGGTFARFARARLDSLRRTPGGGQR